MADLFAGVATPAGICVQASQDNIITEVNKVKDLIPDITADPPVSVTKGGNFDEISPQLASQLRDEIDALITAIDAMAVA